MKTIISETFDAPVSKTENIETLLEIDQALKKEFPRNQSSADNNRGAIKKDDNPGLLPRLMRWIGSIIISAGAATFMIQGIQTVSPFERHWIFLMITALLGVLGLCTGKFMKEVKGARTFLGLSMAALPVLFSQLGAMIFSLFGKAPSSMPQMIIFNHLNASSVFYTTFATSLIMIPVVLFGFTILARSKALILSGTFLIMNCFILIPFRNNTSMIFVLVSMVISIFFIDRTYLIHDVKLKTFEGKIARLMLILPLLVMMIRSCFYPLNFLFFSVLFTFIGVALSWMVPCKNLNSGSFIALHITGTLSTIAGWGIFISDYLNCYSLPLSLETGLLSLPICAIIFGFSFRTRNELSRVFRNFSALLALYIIFKVLLTSPALHIASLVAIIISVLFIISSTILKEKVLFIVGVLQFMGGIGYYFQYAFEFYSQSAWISLILTGVTVLITASVFERNAKLFKSRFSLYKSEFKSWN